MQLSRAKEWTDVLTPLVGIVALLVGGLFGIFQYLDKKQDDRVKETLNFFDRYNSGAALDARRQVIAVWQKHSTEKDRLLNDPAISGDEFNKFAHKVIVEEGLPSSISQIHDFYSALDICVRNNICERQVAILLFKPDARSYYHRHYAYIVAERERTKDPGVGLGLQMFSRICDVAGYALPDRQDVPTSCR